ncbi:DMT family transporter [Brevibacillus choshinensis]|uniref:DMT family transporter n=1 Tax=Brevibacillus choshinensis TaxID=54911 RepID=A0ABX7FW73_BRECH|nr:DMT family transporter [Brevibacillus choshinensis]QRG70115.1 DMT family transporter [Brevibacillus choshinensis]
MIRSYLLLLFCVTLWGSNFVFGSMLVKEFPPLFLADVRLMFTSLFLLSYAWITKKFVKIKPREWGLLILLGLIGTLANQTAYFNGLLTTDATTASLILSMSPIVTAILASLFLKEQFTLRMKIGSAVALLGTFCVVGIGAGLTISKGVMLIVIAMITFSSSMIIIRKLTETMHPFISTVYSTTVGTLFLTPAAFLSIEPGTHISHEVWAWAMLITTAIFMQGVCGLVWNQQLKVVGTGKAAIFLNLQPFVAMLVGFLLLGSQVTAIQATGSLLIVAGVVVASVRSQKSTSNKQTQLATNRTESM